MSHRVPSTLALVALLVGCNQSPEANSWPRAQAPAKPRLAVAASFYPLYEFARHVGGEHTAVIPMVPPGVEPHDWEPAPKDVARIEKARVFVYNGARIRALGGQASWPISATPDRPWSWPRTASMRDVHVNRLGKWHFWLTFVSFNATFFPMHYVGLRGMPRRVFDYDSAFGDLNFAISIASFVLGASFIVFVYNMMTSWVRGPIAEANPWRAHTLEWQVSSPPPIFNFDEIPQVVGGPYEYGVPGARHAVMSPAKEAKEAQEVHA